jgi:hypothetical protein
LARPGRDAGDERTPRNASTERTFGSGITARAAPDSASCRCEYQESQAHSGEPSWNNKTRALRGLDLWGSKESMFRSRIDAQGLIRRARGFDANLARAVSRALNDSAFAARSAWQDEARRVFDRPTPLTINAVLVKKSTPDNLQAEVFIRDETRGGTPPSQYLLPQVAGGARTQKPFEFISKRARPSKFASYYVPGSSFPRDAYGNVPASVIKQIQAQLQVAERASGFSANETFRSRGRRLRRQAKKGIRGGNFFVLRDDHGKLKARTIYERITTGLGSTVRTVFTAVDSAPVYRKRYDVFKIAREVFDREYALRFARALRGLR